MKKVSFLLLTMTLSSVTQASDYNGSNLANWLKEGTYTGTTFEGASCKVNLSDAGVVNHRSVSITSGNEYVAFNSLMPSTLEEMEERPGYIDMTVKHLADDGYTPNRQQSIIIDFRVEGKYVQVYEKELRKFGKESILNCLISY